MITYVLIFYHISMFFQFLKNVSGSVYSYFDGFFDYNIKLTNPKYLKYSRLS